MKYKIRAIYTREALNYCEQDEMSCAEIEVDHMNVRHNTFSEIYLCRKFYVWLFLPGREIYFLGVMTYPTKFWPCILPEKFRVTRVCSKVWIMSKSSSLLIYIPRSILSYNVYQVYQVFYVIAINYNRFSSWILCCETLELTSAHGMRFALSPCYS